MFQRVLDNPLFGMVQGSLNTPSPEPLGALFFEGVPIGYLPQSRLPALYQAELAPFWMLDTQGLAFHDPTPERWEAFQRQWALGQQRELSNERLATSHATLTVDRALVRTLGIETQVVRLVIYRQTDSLWGVRSLTKRINPGRFDNPVAGMVKAHETPWDALKREANEEAGLFLADEMSYFEPVTFYTERPLEDGYLRECTYVWSLFLGETDTLTCQPRDGEVSAFRWLSDKDVTVYGFSDELVPEALYALLIAQITPVNPVFEA